MQPANDAPLRCLERKRPKHRNVSSEQEPKLLDDAYPPEPASFFRASASTLTAASRISAVATCWIPAE
jgi:hypothetical protein